MTNEGRRSWIDREEIKSPSVWAYSPLIFGIPVLIVVVILRILGLI